MLSAVAGSSAIENMDQLADYRVHIIVDDSQQTRGLIWGVVKNLLELLVTETPFELTFVNNPESGRVESRAGLARMMGSVTPHGTGGILEKLDNVLLTELRELLVLPSKEAPNHKKLKVIVILHANPRSLENSVEFAAKSLEEADLSDDRISIQFVQVGFSRRLFDALKDVANDYSNLADFTTYPGAGSTVDQGLGRISLDNVDATLSRHPETSRSTSRHITLVPVDPPRNSLAIAEATLMSGREPRWFRDDEQDLRFERWLYFHRMDLSEGSTRIKPGRHRCYERAPERDRGTVLQCGSQTCRHTRLCTTALPVSGPSFVLHTTAPEYAWDSTAIWATRHLWLV
ncbi:hypothetical protein B0H13DRAFT_1886712 [Mycena leptocephala]|nr:hypothetical protein B0H13DRAFT_1886712 [Mycena leptocephala]